METPVLKFLREQGIKYRLSGEEAEVGCLFESCPNFGEPQLYININTEKFICMRCETKGSSLKQLEYKLGLVNTFQPETSNIFIPLKEIESFENSLLDDIGAMDYLTKKRGFVLETIKQFRLGFVEEEKFNTYTGPAIVIPDFYKGNCVGIEYDFFESPLKYRKKMRFGSKSQLFNIDNIDFSQPVVLTEGRYDAISGYQYGYKNIGSVPNGGNSGDGEWVEEVKHGTKFLIATDNDPVGYTCAEKFAKRIGRTKCFRICLPLKDFNDCLQYGVTKEEIDERVNKAEAMFESPVVDISNYFEAAKEALTNIDLREGVAVEWPTINEIIKGIRMGELTSSSGKTSSGKSTFSRALVGHLIRNEVKCFISAPEEKERDVLIELASNYYKHRPSVDELKEFIDRFRGSVLIHNVFDAWTSKKRGKLNDEIFDVIDSVVKQHKVEFVVLDHMRLFVGSRSVDEQKSAIDAFMEKCINCAVTNNIHIWLIVQPRKTGEFMWPCKQCFKPIYKKMTLDDLKGSGNIAEDSNNVILVHRYLDKFCGCKVQLDESVVEIEVAKNRKFGKCGSVYLKFDPLSKASYAEQS